MKTILTLAAALVLVACAGTTAAPAPAAPAELRTRLSYSPVEACLSYELVTLPARVEVNPAFRAALNPPFRPRFARATSARASASPPARPWRCCIFPN